ncbi:MAG TPA: glycosyltransferase 87 family protein [Vicinamibacterales bacterium]|nr:glycosyltransferase 87 family protein [Vicinamibacterales bacterium]
MSPPPRPAASSPSLLANVLIVTTVTLFAAYLTKQGCFALGIGESFYCHSDMGGIYIDRQLAGGRFPYLAAPLEYPVGLGLILWLAAAVTTSVVSFVRVNMAIVAIASMVTSGILWRHAGRRAMLFAAAPTLAIYAFLNWDMLAVVFAVAAVCVFVRRRDASAGLLVGIGAAIKVFPALLLLPMAAERWRDGERSSAWRIVLAAAAPLVLLNVPVAWVSFDGWAHFFHFNSARPVDWGTLWSVGCQTFGDGLCGNLPLVNALSSSLFLAGGTIAWWLVTRTAPNIPRWQLGFPLMVIFFLTNKVYSPQYSLFILPWFVLALPSLRLFLAYEAIDIGIYVTSFAWQEHLEGSGGLPLWPLNLFIVLRAALLILMLVVFARRAAGSKVVLVNQT